MALFQATFRKFAEGSKLPYAAPSCWPCLRLAQMEDAAKQYDQALAACDRGLEHVTGPMGRSWLLQTKADAYWDAGRPEEARRALEEAPKVAQEIGDQSMRDMNVSMISRKIKMIDKMKK